jgi:hypothetical protein
VVRREDPALGRTDGEESLVVGFPDDAKFVALFRIGAELWGALTVGRPDQPNKLRRLLDDRTSWAGAWTSPVVEPDVPARLAAPDSESSEVARE